MLTNEQADVVANAVMATAKDRQHERAKRREEEARLQHSQRWRGLMFLVALMAGGAVAYLAGSRVVMGMLAGGGLAQVLVFAFNARHRASPVD